MTLRTGNRRISVASSAVKRTSAQAGGRRVGLGFTLIELILVMALLVIVLSVSAPSLSRFFRGQSLDSEAKRFLALTRYGQSRAVSEGLPFVLWIDEKASNYGLQADSSYTEQDPKALEYQVHEKVQLRVEQTQLSKRQATLWKGRGGLASNLPKIRFTPDGFISESSPERVVFRQEENNEIWIGPSWDRLKYEIQTNQLPNLRR